MDLGDDVFQCLDEEGRLLDRAWILKPEIAIEIYRTIHLIRTLDRRMMILQRQGRVGFYGTAYGQEAVPAGVAAALNPEDWIFQALREGACMLHRGYPLEKYIAQVFGNELDPTLGRNMPSHQSDRSVHQVSWSSCIGSQLLHAVGMALGVKKTTEPPYTCAVAFLGDGATSTADAQISLRIAAREKVPCLFVCQNNQWSISVPLARQTKVRALSDKAIGAGMSALRVDGNDPVAIYHRVRSALPSVREGQGPWFIECLTFRLGAHSSSDDPGRYRDQSQVELWQRREPVARMRGYLLENHLGIEAVEQLEADNESRVLEAVETAESAPAVSVGTLKTSLYGAVLDR